MIYEKSSIELRPINTIEDVSTCMRSLASEIGGSHHSPEKAEMLLRNLADRLSEINMQMHLTMHESFKYQGISDDYRKRYLRQQNIKEYENEKREYV